MKAEDPENFSGDNCCPDDYTPNIYSIKALFSSESINVSFGHLFNTIRDVQTMHD